MTALATLAGMDRETGRWKTGLDHVMQSIDDILTTPVGTRICNRDYGSSLPDLVDAPGNDAGLQSLYAATAIAITRHYPFVTLTRITVDLDAAAQGQAMISLEGHETGMDGDTQPLSMTIPLTPLSNLIFSN